MIVSVADLLQAGLAHGPLTRVVKIIPALIHFHPAAPHGHPDRGAVRSDRRVRPCRFLPGGKIVPYPVYAPAAGDHIALGVKRIVISGGAPQLQDAVGQCVIRGRALRVFALYETVPPAGLIVLPERIEDDLLALGVGPRLRGLIRLVFRLLPANVPGLLL